MGCYPEGFLDDDPGRRGLSIDGVPVLGTIDDVARVARSRGVREVMIAIPPADRRAMRRIVERCREERENRWTPGPPTAGPRDPAREAWEPPAALARELALGASPTDSDADTVVDEHSCPW